MKMPLGTNVGLSPGDFELDGDPAPTPKGAVPHPIFGPRLLWRNMVALPNTGGALCSMPQSLADAHY